MLTERPRALAFTAVCAALAVGGLWTVLGLLGDRLPDPMAVHWGGSAPDRSQAPSVFGAQLTGLYLLGALFAASIPWRADLGRRAVRRSLGAGLGLWTGVAIGATGGIAAANLDAASWELAVLDGGDAAIMAAFAIGAPLLGALVGFALAAGPDRASRSVAIPAAELPAGAKVAWSGRQGSPVSYGFAIAASALLLYAALIVESDASVPLTAFGLVAVWAVYALFNGVAVTVGARGVQLRLGLFGWPRVRIALEDIVSARAEDLSPADVGGWGYRVGPARTAVMLRGGECLVLARTGGREFAVSVDGAAEAAALVNGLLKRAEAA
ncbi:hypothetical protein [Glycomyces tenuis]|uniref:hypothetical protein n=1 Tax=Glycomyces tenuis TaxID=58116 RepID=UPI000413C50D|nr:hypothetical protein [Glycomyces tenuis]